MATAQLTTPTSEPSSATRLTSGSFRWSRERPAVGRSPARLSIASSVPPKSTPAESEQTWPKAAAYRRASTHTSRSVWLVLAKRGVP